MPPRPSTRFAAQAHRARLGRRGFTIIELLVVAGVIALLIGILLPSLTSARRESKRKATLSQFQSISAALDRYKAEWGQYPRSDGDKPPTPPFHQGDPDRYRTGGELLVDYLCGPDDAYVPDTTPQPSELRYYWLLNKADTIPDEAQIPPRSGLKKINTPGVAQFGRTLGPYIEYSPERVRTFLVDGDERMLFVDSWGGPILYWRAIRGQADTTPSDVFPPHDNLPILDAAEYDGVSSDWDTNNIWRNYVQTETGPGEAGPVPDRDRFLLISAGPNNKFGWPTLGTDPLRTNDPNINDDLLSCREGDR